ncbi:MAG: hypothetical protein MK085_08940 [Phycisphaerales bacterium]|nr:hypothetical protein [Phycisphaerales bacterium]
MHRFMKKAGLVIAISGAAVGLTACQSSYRAHAKKIDSVYASGEYSSAASIAAEGADKKANDKSERVIYNLEAARTAQVAGDPATSRQYYDAVYEDIYPYLNTEADGSVSEAIVTTAVNQAMATYKATPGERVMSNSLNAINCLAMGDRDAARIELNRAKNWQQDAQNRYAVEMEKAQQEARNDAREQGLDEAMNDGVPSYLDEKFNNLEPLRGYADYQNPFANHLRGVFYLACGTDMGDRDAARFNFREALKLNPEAASAIEPDLAVTELRDKRTATTWIYIMTGRAPRLDEFRLDIPIPVGNVNYVSAAFPELKTHEDHVEAFHADVDGMRIDAVELSNIDGIVASEFQVRLPTIISQEILSSAGKAAATWALGESAGAYGQIAGMVYQAASTSADLRTWRTIPKEIMLCRVPTPASGVINIGAEGGRNLGSVSVAPGESNLVVVTLPSAKAPTPGITTAQLTDMRPRGGALESSASVPTREPAASIEETDPEPIEETTVVIIENTPPAEPVEQQGKTSAQEEQITELTEDMQTALEKFNETGDQEAAESFQSRADALIQQLQEAKDAVNTRAEVVSTPAHGKTPAPSETPRAVRSNPSTAYTPAREITPPPPWMTPVDLPSRDQIIDQKKYNIELALHADQNARGHAPNGLKNMGKLTFYRVEIPRGELRIWEHPEGTHKVLLWGDDKHRQPKVFSRTNGRVDKPRHAGNRGNGQGGQISYLLDPGTDLVIWDKSGNGWTGWALVTSIETSQDTP